MDYTRLLIARHGQTYGNVEQLMCGHSESELTPLGIAQARALGRRLASEDIAAAFASDLSRARETARHILDPRDVPLALEPRLREMHYGEWEARPRTEIFEQYPELIRGLVSGEGHPPGGETLAQLRERTVAATRELVAQHHGKTILLVSHGNAIMALLAELLEMPAPRLWSFQVDNASLTTLLVYESGHLTLLGLNDVRHIEGLQAAAAQ
ncbi:MAG: histidine phosphatase family protein [Dehalococcoidia bacterium]|nr:histidine phosphatase family protein [Dehalococcoidia bacterium]